MPSICVILLLLAIATKGIAAGCDCGWTVNSTQDLYHAVFTDALWTDFRTSTDVTWTSEPGNTWQAQVYNTSAGSNGPYGKAAQSGNVVLNQGSHAINPGVQLCVRSKLIADGFDELVSVAEMVTARRDILYGSFRFTMLTTNVSGTCGAAFFYKNDSQEIDMEILSKERVMDDQGSVHFIIQPPVGSAAAANVAANPYMTLSMISAPWTTFSEYRFDWLPDRVDFYVNNVHRWSIYDNIPNSPGQIHISHWSNGNAGWSAGPPQEDAVLTVQSVLAYFNTSGTDRAPAFDGTCAKTGDNPCSDDGTGLDSTSTASGSPSLSATSSATLATPSSGAKSLGDGRPGFSVLVLAAILSSIVVGVPDFECFVIRILHL